MIRPDEAIERLRAANAVPSLDELDPAELAAVTALLEERKSAMTIRTDEQAHPEISHSPRRRRPAMAFVMALVIVALAVGVVVLTPNGGGDEVVDTPTSTPPPATIPARPIDLGWEQVPGPDWGGDDWIVVGDRLFGLGWKGCPDVETPGEGDSCARAAIWTWSAGPWSEGPWSEGSEGWSPVMVDEEFIPQSDEGWTSLESITYVNGRYIAVGYIQLLAEDTWGPRGPTRVWTSPDGITWTRVQEGPGDGLATLTSGSRLVVVTREANGEPGQPSTIWVSENGTDWTEAFRAAPSSEIRDVIEGGSGFVAVGEACNGDASCGAAVWASDGGVSWRQVWSSPGDTMTEMMWVGERYFAFGRTPGHTALWTSRQGTEWDLVAEFPASGSRGIIPKAVVKVDGGFLLACATGWDGWWDSDSQRFPNGDPGPSTLWTSADGTEWTQISDPHGVFARSEITDLIPVAEGVLALGIKDMREETNDGRYSSYPARGAMWASPDGASWQQAQLDKDPLGAGGPVLGMTTLFETRILVTAPGANSSPVVIWASGP